MLCFGCCTAALPFATPSTRSVHDSLVSLQWTPCSVVSQQTRDTFSQFWNRGDQGFLDFVRGEMNAAPGQSATLRDFGDLLVRWPRVTCSLLCALQKLVPHGHRPLKPAARQEDLPSTLMPLHLMNIGCRTLHKVSGNSLSGATLTFSHTYFPLFRSLKDQDDEGVFARLLG